jgi:hypothetical protein
VLPVLSVLEAELARCSSSRLLPVAQAERVRGEMASTSVLPLLL